MTTFFLRAGHKNKIAIWPIIFALIFLKAGAGTAAPFLIAGPGFDALEQVALADLIASLHPDTEGTGVVAALNFREPRDQSLYPPDLAAPFIAWEGERTAPAGWLIRLSARDAAAAVPDFIPPGAIAPHRMAPGFQTRAHAPAPGGNVR